MMTKLEFLRWRRKQISTLRVGKATKIWDKFCRRVYKWLLTEDKE